MVEFGCGGFVYYDVVCCFYLCWCNVVSRGYVVFVDVGVVSCAYVCGVDQVFYIERHAVQRAERFAGRDRRFGLLRGLDGRLAANGGVGIELGLRALDRGQHHFRVLDRRELVPPDQVRGIGGGKKEKLVGHGVSCWER